MLLPCEESERGRGRLGRAWVRYHIPGAPDPNQTRLDSLAPASPFFFFFFYHRQPPGPPSGPQSTFTSVPHLPSLLTSRLWKAATNGDPIEAGGEGEGVKEVRDDYR